MPLCRPHCQLLGFRQRGHLGFAHDPADVSTTATASSPVGTYTITASGAADANYTISYVAGTLSVTPAA